jgi:hypothetical protein
VRRYAESSAQIVFHDLLLDIQGGPELERKLQERIGMFPPDAEHKCRDFMAPSRETVEQREDLKRKEVLLKDLLHKLSRF